MSSLCSAFSFLQGWPCNCKEIYCKNFWTKINQLLAWVAVSNQELVIVARVQQVILMIGNAVWRLLLWRIEELSFCLFYWNNHTKKLQNKITPLIFVILSRQIFVREADSSGIVEDFRNNSKVNCFLRFLGTNGFG